MSIVGFIDTPNRHLYNRDNFRTLETLYGPNRNAANQAFGSALSYYPPREVQLGVRFTF